VIDDHRPGPCIHRRADPSDTGPRTARCADLYQQGSPAPSPGCRAQVGGEEIDQFGDGGRSELLPVPVVEVDECRTVDPVELLGLPGLLDLCSSIRPRIPPPTEGHPFTSTDVPFFLRTEQSLDNVIRAGTLAAGDAFVPTLQASHAHTCRTQAGAGCLQGDRPGITRGWDRAGRRILPARSSTLSPALRSELDAHRHAHRLAGPAPIHHQGATGRHGGSCHVAADGLVPGCGRLRGQPRSRGPRRQRTGRRTALAAG
jgi:hypothetical protein